MKTTDKTKKGKRPIADPKECKASPKKIKLNPSSTRIRASPSPSGRLTIAEFSGKIPLLRPPSANNPRSRFVQFDNEDEAKRLLISTSKLHVNIDRNFDLISFIPPFGELLVYMLKCLYRWVHSHAWEISLSGHKCIPNIVRVFYFRGSHLVSNSYAKPEDNIIAKV